MAMPTSIGETARTPAADRPSRYEDKLRSPFGAWCRPPWRAKVPLGLLATLALVAACSSDGGGQPDDGAGAGAGCAVGAAGADAGGGPNAGGAGTSGPRRSTTPRASLHHPTSPRLLGVLELPPRAEVALELHLVRPDPGAPCQGAWFDEWGRRWALVEAGRALGCFGRRDAGQAA